MDELDPRTYGLVVRNKDRQGVLLPDLEGVDSHEEQIQICRTKGKIDKIEPVEMFRFKVNRYR